MFFLKKKTSKNPEIHIKSVLFVSLINILFNAHGDQFDNAFFKRTKKSLSHATKQNIYELSSLLLDIVASFDVLAVAVKLALFETAAADEVTDAATLVVLATFVALPPTVLLLLLLLLLFDRPTPTLPALRQMAIQSLARNRER